MARLSVGADHGRERFPHTRGDGPIVRFRFDRADVISPHAWGWPEALRERDEARKDFPTRVG